ncbi:MAG: hypothetical protein ACR2MD_15200 [Aridibacter sp.]
MKNSKIKSIKTKTSEVIKVQSEVWGELFLDKNLAEGILREFPFVKFIFGGIKAVKTYQEYLYFRKLILFLENIQDASEEDFRKFSEDAEINSDNFSHSLLLILDKIEDERKAVLIAGVFKLYIRNRFSYEKFNKILLIINRGFCPDLLQITVFQDKDVVIGNNKLIETESIEELLSCGLLHNVGIDGGDFEGESGGFMYKLNQYGEILLQVVKESDIDL